MSIFTQLPDISAQSRPFISGRSKGTWHGVLYTYMNKGKGGGRKIGIGGKGVGRNTGGCVSVCLQTNAEFGVKHVEAKTLQGQAKCSIVTRPTFLSAVRGGALVGLGTRLKPDPTCPPAILDR